MTGQNRMTAFACDMTSLTKTERERHHALISRLLSSRVDQKELENGFLLTVGSGMPASEVAEWISLEVRCCPFLSFDLQLAEGRPALVTLSGPDGVKPFIVAELGLS